MERLTKKEQLGGHDVNFVSADDCFDTWSVPKKFMGAAIDRLAAYEDTGLEPEEVKELAQAEQEGRLVVLPCKVGDAVYYRLDNGMSQKETVTSIGVDKKGIFVGTTIAFFREADFGKTVFLTREEAEAAQKGGVGNG